MKRLLVVLLGLMVVVVAACGNKENDENAVDPLEDLIGSTSLTTEDLDRIDEYRFPKSYTYSVYGWNMRDSEIESWAYVYPEKVKHKFLLPVHEEMTYRSVVSSVVDENNVIITTMRVTLDDGETYSVKYMNNSDTLKYMEALVETPTRITSYMFEY